jgi:hypothetical protein
VGGGVRYFERRLIGADLIHDPAVGIAEVFSSR